MKGYENPEKVVSPPKNLPVSDCGTGLNFEGCTWVCIGYFPAPQSGPKENQGIIDIYYMPIRKLNVYQDVHMQH